jgi:DNA-binding response OmpR family regulator
MTQDAFCPTIIAIDDEEIILESVKFLLEVGGFNVETFSDPKEAESRISSNDVEFLILVLDHDFSLVGLPEYHGYDFAKFAKLNHWSKCVLPIIYLTGREDRQSFDIESALLGGAAPDDYLHKSEIGLLLQRVNKWSDRLYNFEATIDEFGREIALDQYCGPRDF